MDPETNGAAEDAPQDLVDVWNTVEQTVEQELSKEPEGDPSPSKDIESADLEEERRWRY